MLVRGSVIAWEAELQKRDMPCLTMDGDLERGKVFVRLCGRWLGESCSPWWDVNFVPKREGTLVVGRFISSDYLIVIEWECDT